MFSDWKSRFTPRTSLYWSRAESRNEILWKLKISMITICKNKTSMCVSLIRCSFLEFTMRIIFNGMLNICNVLIHSNFLKGFCIMSGTCTYRFVICVVNEQCRHLNHDRVYTMFCMGFILSKQWNMRWPSVEFCLFWTYFKHIFYILLSIYT